jgi:hypothetical protein
MTTRGEDAIDSARIRWQEKGTGMTGVVGAVAGRDNVAQCAALKCHCDGFSIFLCIGMK